MTGTATHGAGSPGSIDVHAHFFPAGLRAPRGTGFPELHIGPDGNGRIMTGSQVFRRVRSPLWDIDDRIAKLDEAAIGVQVMSPVPVTLSPDGPADLAADYLRTQNGLLAAAAAGSGGRLLAFGAVPASDPVSAADEVIRLAGLPGIVGVEIGTVPGGHELDSPALHPLLAAAQEQDMPIFVHPTEQATAVRRGGSPYTFGIGMHTDTALAATALVFGGVLERFPRLRVALAHGCGSLPWTYPRLRYGATIDGTTDPARLDDLLRSLWCDTLVFDPAHLPLLAERFGTDHLLIGTDFPFYPSPLAELIGIVGDAERSAALPPGSVTSVGRDNALRFLGLHDVPRH